MLAFNHGRRWKTHSKCRPDPKSRKMEKSIVRTVVVLKYVDGKCFPNCTGAGVGIQGIAEAERSSLMRNMVDTRTGPERCALHAVPGVCSTRSFFLSLLPLKMCLTAWADDARVSASGGVCWGRAEAEAFPLRGQLEAQSGWMHSATPAWGGPGQLSGGHSRWAVSPRGSQRSAGTGPHEGVTSLASVTKGVKATAILFRRVYRRSLSTLLADCFSVLAASRCVPLQDLKVSCQERGNRIIGGFLVRRKSVYWEYGC